MDRITSLDMPISRRAGARARKIGDTVTLEKTLFGIRDATLIHMFDRGRAHALRSQRPRGDPHRPQCA